MMFLLECQGLCQGFYTLTGKANKNFVGAEAP
jgi:hypothetical protein